MPTHDPPQPGGIVRRQCLEPLRLSVTEASEGLGVTRQALSDLLNGKVGISGRSGTHHQSALFQSGSPPQFENLRTLRALAKRVRITAAQSQVWRERIKQRAKKYRAGSKRWPRPATNHGFPPRDELKKRPLVHLTGRQPVTPVDGARAVPAGWGSSLRLPGGFGHQPAGTMTGARGARCKRNGAGGGNPPLTGADLREAWSEC